MVTWHHRPLASWLRCVLWLRIPECLMLCQAAGVINHLSSCNYKMLSIHIHSYPCLRLWWKQFILRMLVRWWRHVSLPTGLSHQIMENATVLSASSEKASVTESSCGSCSSGSTPAGLLWDRFRHKKSADQWVMFKDGKDTTMIKVGIFVWFEIPKKGNRMIQCQEIQRSTGPAHLVFPHILYDSPHQVQPQGATKGFLKWFEVMEIAGQVWNHVCSCTYICITLYHIISYHHTFVWCLLLSNRHRFEANSEILKLPPNEIIKCQSLWALPNFDHFVRLEVANISVPFNLTWSERRSRDVDVIWKQQQQQLLNWSDL